MAELDYMEYANDAAAQAAYPTSEATVDVVSEEYNQTPNDYVHILGTGGIEEEIAQDFQLSENITCSKVAVKLRKNASPTDNIILTIETDSSGAPSGTLVDANATKTIAASGLTTSYVYCDFVFPGTFSLSSSTVYHIRIARSGTRDSTNVVHWGIILVGAYGNGTTETLDNGTWSDQAYDCIFQVYKQLPSLQDYSEAVIKQQGSYSLKGIAKATYSLNETLTRTIGTPINLSGHDTLKFGIYASRTGANIKIGIHDSGGVTTEKTHTVGTANTWETDTWDISGVSDANKDAIDSIIITIVNADADNTFYIDNFYGLLPPLSINVSESLSIAESIGGKGGTLPSSVSDAISIAESIIASLPDALKSNVSDAVTLAESIKLNLIPLIGVTDAIFIAEAITASLPDALRATVTDTISITESISIAVSACILSVTDNISIADAVEIIIPFCAVSVSDAISIAESVSLWFPYYDVYSLDLYIDQVKSMDLFIKTTKTLDMYIDQVKSFTMEH